MMGVKEAFSKLKLSKLLMPNKAQTWQKRGITSIWGVNEAAFF
jgi:hypothetical protein